LKVVDTKKSGIVDDDDDDDGDDDDATRKDFSSRFLRINAKELSEQSCGGRFHHG